MGGGSGREEGGWCRTMLGGKRITTHMIHKACQDLKAVNLSMSNSQEALRGG